MLRTRKVRKEEPIKKFRIFIKY